MNKGEKKEKKEREEIYCVVVLLSLSLLLFSSAVGIMVVVAVDPFVVDGEVASEASACVLVLVEVLGSC